MDKDAIRQQLEEVVLSAHTKYPEFLGVCLYGSFVTNKPNPKDVDVIDVYDKTRMAQNQFASLLRVRGYITKEFPELPEESWIQRSDGAIQKELIHFGTFGCLAINNIEVLSRNLNSYKIRTEDFIGLDEARQAIQEALAYQH